MSPPVGAVSVGTQLITFCAWVTVVVVVVPLTPFGVPPPLTIVPVPATCASAGAPSASATPPAASAQLSRRRIFPSRTGERVAVARLSVVIDAWVMGQPARPPQWVG